MRPVAQQRCYHALRPLKFRAFAFLGRCARVRARPRCIDIRRFQFASSGFKAQQLITYGRLATPAQEQTIGMKQTNKVDLSHCLLATVEGRSGAQAGELSGLRYVAKDLFDVAGVPTTAGNPDFAQWHGVPREDAWAIKALERAGAELIGKTNLHELAYGITGVNPHFGTPKNPRDPQRIPGGSSSGSAVAVSGGLVPFALGTDTGGSVRVPASFCGIYGFRPTHDHIPAAGVVPLAASFDTVGVFAASASILEAVSRVLLQPPAKLPVSRLDRALVATDALALAEPAGQAAVGRARRALEAIGIPVTEVNTGLLQAAFDSQRVVQAAEAWGVHEQWVNERKPRLGRDVARLLQAASELKPGDIGRASAARNRVVRQTEALLAGRAILVLAAAPGFAPKLKLFDDPQASLEARGKILLLTNLASTCGLPVVVVPAAKEDEPPVGVALNGPKGSDLQLLEIAKMLDERLRAANY
jgi:amidase